MPAIVTSSGVSMVQQQAILHYLGRATGMDCDCEDMHRCEVLALGVGEWILEAVACKRNGRSSYKH